MAYIRSHFGKVSCCRVFESFDNGYPHIHCILLFQEYSFSVFRDAKGKFRATAKKQGENVCLKFVPKSENKTYNHFTPIKGQASMR
jgi:hypothetical protein